MLVLSLSPGLSSADCGSVTAPSGVFPGGEVGAGTEVASTRGSDDAADSWSVLVPTFILDSVDLRLDNGGMGAYSCADGTGGGKNGDPGDGKGGEERRAFSCDERMDSLRAQTFCVRGDDS